MVGKQYYKYNNLYLFTELLHQGTYCIRYYIPERACNVTICDSLPHRRQPCEVREWRSANNWQWRMVDGRPETAAGIYVGECKHWHRHYSIWYSALCTIIKWIMWILVLWGAAIETLSVTWIVLQQGFSYTRGDIWRHRSLITLLYWLRCQCKNKCRPL
jgi:hypothetical protein